MNILLRRVTCLFSIRMFLHLSLPCPSALTAAILADVKYLQQTEMRVLTPIALAQYNERTLEV